VADAVEAAQLTPERSAEIGKRLNWKALAMSARELLNVIDAHQ
jgi:hypothetical protein